MPAIQWAHLTRMTLGGSGASMRSWGSFVGQEGSGLDRDILGVQRGAGPRNIVRVTPVGLPRTTEPASGKGARAMRSAVNAFLIPTLIQVSPVFLRRRSKTRPGSASHQDGT